MKQNETKFCSFSIIYVKVLGELWFCKSGFKVTEKVVSSQLVATVFFKTKTINEIKKYKSTHWKVFYKISCSTFFPGGFLVKMLEKMSVKDFTLNKFTGPKLAILLKIELLHKISHRIQEHLFWRTPLIGCFWKGEWDDIKSFDTLSLYQNYTIKSLISWNKSYHKISNQFLENEHFSQDLELNYDMHPIPPGFPILPIAPVFSIWCMQSYAHTLAKVPLI